MSVSLKEYRDLDRRGATKHTLVAESTERFIYYYHTAIQN